MSVYTFPVGATTDTPFKDQDLLDVWREFPSNGTDAAYFANPQQTVICMPSVLNPAVQWCSTAAESNPWVTMPGLPFVHHTLVVPTPPVHIPPVGTPEPHYESAMLIVFLLALFVGWCRRMIG